MGGRKSTYQRESKHSQHTKRMGATDKRRRNNKRAAKQRHSQERRSRWN